MPQASERLLATPKINPRLPRSRPPPSTMTRLEHRCWDGDRAGSGSTNAVLRLKGNAEIPGFPPRSRNLHGSASYDTAFPALQARQDALVWRGNTGNPRVFFHHAAMAMRPDRRLNDRPVASAKSRRCRAGRGEAD